MRFTNAELLKDKIEETVAQVIKRTGPKRLPFRPSQRYMHRMVSSVVAEFDFLEECAKAKAKAVRFWTCSPIDRKPRERGMELEKLKSIAAQELKKHGLHGWAFGLADTKRRLGVCKYRQKRIEIAEYYARHSPEESVLDTLMHEIAHALAGPAANHGPRWKAVAIRLGATPRSCETSQQAVVEPGDWQATCPACKRTAQLYRRPRSLTGYRCRCEARSPLTFEYRGDPALKPAVPTTARESARWEARCAGCETVHLRVRRPKVGVWRCKCPHRGELAWRARPTGGPEEQGGSP